MANTCLIDTNIFVYALNRDSEFHGKCKSLVNESLTGKIKAYTADKCLYEFFAIVTDGKRIEKPIKTNEAIEIINLILNSEIKTLFSSEETINQTMKLVAGYKVKKQDIFDYVIAGIMLENNITGIYTFNTKDFNKIEEIEILKF